MLKCSVGQAVVAEMRAKDLAELKKDMKTLEEFVKEYDYDPSRFDFTFDDADSE